MSVQIVATGLHSSCLSSHANFFDADGGPTPLVFVNSKLVLQISFFFAAPISVSLSPSALPVCGVALKFQTDGLVA